MNLSLGVFFSLLGLLLIYDVWTLVKRGYSTTVSAALLKFSQRFPIVPFAGGVLIGHLLWPNLGACLP